MTICELTSPTLREPIVITEHHLAIFDALYRYGRLDFPTLRLAAPNLPWTDGTLRLKLYELDRANCIHVFYGNLAPPIFAILDRGLAIYLDETNRPAQRTTQPRHQDAERIRKHDAGLSAYLVRQEAAVAAAGGFSVCARDIWRQAGDAKVQNEHRWPVSFAYAGRFHHTHVKPDDIRFHNDASGGVTYKVTEFDASSETKNPRTFRLRPANLHAKLIAYQATLENRLIERYLGITDPQIDFVFLTEQRRRNAEELGDAVLSPVWREVFSFGTGGS